jgi:hypothetical protein
MLNIQYLLLLIFCTCCTTSKHNIYSEELENSDFVGVNILCSKSNVIIEFHLHLDLQ